MQVEPYEEDDGKRIWLSENEEEQLLKVYQEEPKKQLALELGLLGLRADEIVRVAREDIRELQVEEDRYKLVVSQSKTGYRETPLPEEVKSMMTMQANVRNLHQDEPVVDVTKRTVQRWVQNAAGQVQEQTGNDNWEYLTCHDLRRTWATRTYYKLNGSSGDLAKSVIMRWGGWIDEQTFERNYLGRETDKLAAEMMETAGLA